MMKLQKKIVSVWGMGGSWDKIDLKIDLIYVIVVFTPNKIRNIPKIGTVVKCGKTVFRYSPFVLLYDFLILLYIVFVRIIKRRRFLHG